MITQHIDRNIGPRAFAGLDKDVLLITSIFYTVQGEGPYAGCPAIFVRLAGCNRGSKLNMGCPFCDTDFRIDKSKAMTFIQIHQHMRQEMGDTWGMPIVVITGGEPMMQNNLAGFIRFLRNDVGFNSIQVESNGDRLVPGFPEFTTTLVVSPKVTGKLYRPLSQEIMDAATCLKFVISADPQSPYHNVPEWARQRRDRVFLSPMTIYKREVAAGEVTNAWDSSLVDHEATQANYSRAAKLAMENNYRLSMQQHLFYGIP